jgi:GT2 family glycosyltransferase
MCDLSVVLPTCNRAKLLRGAIAAIISATRCNFELIVVDGASNDDTSAVLEEAKAKLGDRLQIIREEVRGGFVRATNAGFRAARGRNLTWLNDDCRPLSGSLDRAVEQIDAAPPDVAFVAMFHRWHSRRNIAYHADFHRRPYVLCHVRGTLYGNFPVGRTETFARLGYFDQGYWVAAADPDLSLKAWHAGLRVVPAYGCAIDHDEIDDPRRQLDQPKAVADNQRLFAKWDLPPKSILTNDFDARRPNTLRGLRNAAENRPDADPARATPDVSVYVRPTKLREVA